MPPRRPLPHWLLIAALTLATLPAPLAAQRHADLVAGAELRVHLAGTPPLVVRGDLLTLDSAALAVARFHGDSLRIPYDEITRVELRRARSLPAAFGRGAVRGLVVGLIASGALLAAGAYADQRDPCGDCYISATGAAAIAGIALTGMTTAAGGLIGLTRRGHWVTVARAPTEPD